MIGAFPASRGHPQGQIEYPTWLAIPGVLIPDSRGRCGCRKHLLISLNSEVQKHEVSKTPLH